MNKYLIYSNSQKDFTKYYIPSNLSTEVCQTYERLNCQGCGSNNGGVYNSLAKAVLFFAANIRHSLGYNRKNEINIIQLMPERSTHGISNAIYAALLDLADKSLDGNKLKQVHASLTGFANSNFRVGDAWVGTTASAAGAICVFPPAAMIPSLMDNYLDAYNRWPLNDFHILALSHLQFTAIHPFRDGNGRISRVLAASKIHHEKFGLIPGACSILINMIKKPELVAAQRRAQGGAYLGLLNYWFDVYRRALSMADSLGAFSELTKDTFSSEFLYLALTTSLLTLGNEITDLRILEVSPSFLERISNDTYKSLLFERFISIIQEHLA
jgi:hypothetical protein